MALTDEQAVALQTAAANITDISGSDKRVVQIILRHAIANGWSAETLARRLRPLIGLGPRYALAVENLRTGLKNGITVHQANGKTHTRKLSNQQIEQRVKTYTERLRRQRRRLIATTEINTITNEAQRLLWQEQQAQGEIPMNARRVFHYDHAEHGCKLCMSLDGKSVPVTQSGGPPIHPNCGCWETLEHRGQRA